MASFFETLARVKDNTLFNDVLSDVNDSFEYGQMPEDKQRDLDKLITILAIDSIIPLVASVYELISLGKSTNGIHPLSSLEFFRATEERYDKFKKVFDQSQCETTFGNPYGWVFACIQKQFLDGFCHFLQMRHGENDLLMHVKDFCERTKFEEELITPFILEENWRGLIETIIPK